MDSQQSMPQVNLSQVSVDDSTNPPTDELGSTQLQPAADNSVVYANQPLQVGNNQQSAALPETAVPNLADDVDLIEKEWVNKTDDIIQKTKGDPYERSRQLALLKSEYLQKRYQKTIKLT